MKVYFDRLCNILKSCPDFDTTFADFDPVTRSRQATRDNWTHSECRRAAPGCYCNILWYFKIKPKGTNENKRYSSFISVLPENPWPRSIFNTIISKQRAKEVSFSFRFSIFVFVVAFFAILICKEKHFLEFKSNYKFYIEFK
jgi:hypothetical protein